MKSRYDVLVVGGGPGGAVAAETAAKAGLSVCLAEKRPAIGTPVRCAEGIGRDVLSEFIEPDPAWISADITEASVVAPDGTELVFDSKAAGNKVGYVLERKIFDRALVKKAAEAGADIAVKTTATKPVIENGRVRGAYLTGAVPEVHADVVIAADGVESRFARMCGIDTSVPASDMMTCVQALMTGIDIAPGRTVFNVGNTIAPQGYLWIFPKGNRTANVGIGISGKKCGDGHRPKDYLDNFVKKKFPDGKCIEFIAGGVPVCRPLSSTVADGLMIVGDAARVVDPFTGGGIYNAMFTGRLAGQVAADCIARGDCTKKALGAYDKAWRASDLGKSLERNYKIKEYFIRQTDDKFNRLIRSASAIRLEEFSTLGLVRELVIRNPGLLSDLSVIRDFIR
ncbi:MAG TPA: NAD(P)/FAD-dependent oxidoreductase [Methanoregula sp.]|nr:NAD(P)/FAD-dependent oxidoreductase [Methanoregula sp.]